MVHLRTRRSVNTFICSWWMCRRLCIGLMCAALVAALPALSLAQAYDVVLFATASGISQWSSNDGSIQTISTFPSYEIEVSPGGVIYVGNGGVDSAASGVPSSGIYQIDGAGTATLYSNIVAEDLEFDENGDLYASNSQGIFRIDSGGTAVQVSTNPTNQFAFIASNTVMTTNGATFGSTFGFSTDQIDLSTDTTVNLRPNGGEDVEVVGGNIYTSGLGGIYSNVGGSTFPQYTAMEIFDVEPALGGGVYWGNPSSFGGTSWTPGLYHLAADWTTMTPILGQDINSIAVVTVPEPGAIVLLGLSGLSLLRRSQAGMC